MRVTPRPASSRMFPASEKSAHNILDRVDDTAVALLNVLWTTALCRKRAGTLPYSYLLGIDRSAPFRIISRSLSSAD